MENWKDVKGYEGLYKISESGKIKSLRRKVRSKHGLRTKKERILKANRSGRYEKVSLCKEGDCKQYSVHRLVAENFIRIPNKSEVVNHMDGDKLNNHYKNLEWCTPKQNNEHAKKNRLWNNHGIGNRLSKFSKDDVLNIRKEKKLGKTNLEISKVYGVHEATIGKLIRGETYKHY